MKLQTNKKLDLADIGKWFTYPIVIGGREEDEQRGILKAFNNESKIAWIVFACNNDWENWENYTADPVAYRDIKELRD